MIASLADDVAGLLDGPFEVLSTGHTSALIAGLQTRHQTSTAYNTRADHQWKVRREGDRLSVGYTLLARSAEGGILDAINSLTYAVDNPLCQRDVGSSEPTIAEVKQAWIEEATRVGLIGGVQDAVGLQRLKGVLGTTYASLVPGCDAGGLRLKGLGAIRRWKAA